MSRTRFVAGPLDHVNLNAALDELELLAQGGVTLATTTPAMDGTGAAGVSSSVSRGDHVHPSDTSRLSVSANLSDLGSAALARTNLGLGALATLGVGAGLASSSGNLVVSFGGVAPAMNGTASAGAASTAARSDHVHPSDTSRLAAASNLSDLASAATARTNLGLTAIATLASGAQGSVVYFGPSGPVSLAPGTSGYLLQTNGASANPTWVAPPSGTVGSATPLMNGTAAVGTAVNASHEDHVHPSDTSRLAAASNLSDLGSATTARSNLGLGAIALLNVGGGLSSLAGFLNPNYGSSAALLAMNGTAAVGSSSLLPRMDHVHPSDTSRLAAASNLSDLASAATARSNLGVAAGGCSWSFGLGQVVANGSLVVDIPYGFTLNSLITYVGTAGGSFSVTVSIGGTNVTGMTAISVSSSTDSTATASAANTGSAGQVVVAIASTSGSPTDSKIILRWTR